MNALKPLLFVFSHVEFILVVLLGVMVSCSDIMHDITLENNFTAEVSHSYRLGPDLLFRIDRVEDSRCPARVQCIQAGDARVFLSIERPIAIDTSFTVIENKIVIQSYTFELIDVSPYRETPGDIKQKDYRVTMVIRK